MSPRLATILPLLYLKLTVLTGGRRLLDMHVGEYTRATVKPDHPGRQRSLPLLRRRVGPALRTLFADRPCTGLSDDGLYGRRTNVAPQ